MLKAVFLVLAVLALTGCTYTTPQQDAAAACSGVVNPNIRDACVAQYMLNAQAETNAEWGAIGASMLNRPRETSCTNIGGIVSCSSR